MRSICDITKSVGSYLDDKLSSKTPKPRPTISRPTLIDYEQIRLQHFYAAATPEAIRAYEEATRRPTTSQAPQQPPQQQPTKPIFPPPVAANLQKMNTFKKKPVPPAGKSWYEPETPPRSEAGTRTPPQSQASNPFVPYGEVDYNYSVSKIRVKKSGGIYSGEVE